MSKYSLRAYGFIMFNCTVTFHNIKIPVFNTKQIFFLQLKFGGARVTAPLLHLSEENQYKREQEKERETDREREGGEKERKRERE